MPKSPRNIADLSHLPASGSASEAASQIIEFPDNRHLVQLFGAQNKHLIRLEQAFRVSVACRGNRVVLTGDADAVNVARTLLDHAYQRLERHLPLDDADMDALIASAHQGVMPVAGMTMIKTRLRTVYPKTPSQQAYLDALANNDVVLGVGPAGTGKTYLATAMGVSMLAAGRVRRLVLTRPAVEAGEKLGFLPGDMREKVDPYLRPLFDALHEMMGSEAIERAMACQDIEIAPLAFMRGRTLSHAYIIVDEAQNTTAAQMKMVLTRLGPGSKMVVNGDLSQIDLPRGIPSGLGEAVRILADVAHVRTVQFDAGDVIRHPIVADIIRAYDRDTQT